MFTKRRYNRVKKRVINQKKIKKLMRRKNVAAYHDNEPEWDLKYKSSKELRKYVELDDYGLIKKKDVKIPFKLKLEYNRFKNCRIERIIADFHGMDYTIMIGHKYDSKIFELLYNRTYGDIPTKTPTKLDEKEIFRLINMR